MRIFWNRGLRALVDLLGNGRSAVAVILALWLVSCVFVASARATAPDSSNHTKTNASDPSATQAEAQPNYARNGYASLPLMQSLQVPAGPKENPWLGVVGSLITLLGALAWPVAAAWTVWYAVKTPRLSEIFARVVPRIGKLSVAGLTFELNMAAKLTLDDLRDLIRQVPEVNRDWVSNTHIGTQFHLVLDDLRCHLTSSSFNSGTPLSNEDWSSFRFTIHVADALFAHSFRQLIDYTGSETRGAGRIFSMRLGIIGLAWRKSKSQFCNKGIDSPDDLVEKWGMTWEEAQDRSRDKNVYLAFLIKSKQKLPLAIIYADSKKAGIFKSQPHSSEKAIFTEIEAKLLQFCDTHGLTESLGQLEDERVKLPQVDLYRIGGR